MGVPSGLLAAKAAPRPLPAEAGCGQPRPVYRPEAEPRVHSRPQTARILFRFLAHGHARHERPVGGGAIRFPFLRRLARHTTKERGAARRVTHEESGRAHVGTPVTVRT